MLKNSYNGSCAGCSACAQVCPLHCIEMKPDNEGFLYPFIDSSICVHCGKCDAICADIHNYEKRNPLKVFACVNKDREIRLKSSSAGVFSALALEMIEEGGVVCAARFDDDFSVVHDIAHSVDELHSFIGSKYVQSDTQNGFSKVLECLRSGTNVLFVGTPCQVAGLNGLLNPEIQNRLISVELCCHGVPSPKIWKQYLIEQGFDSESTRSISFRDKSNGWRNYSLSIIKTNGSNFCEGKDTNGYMRGFLNNLYCRPSCSNCQFRQFSTKSDISIGDFWSIHKFYPNFDDNTGYNQALILSIKGFEFFQKVSCNYLNSFPITIGESIIGNQNYIISVPYHRNRLKFWKLVEKGESVSDAVSLCLDGRMHGRLRHIINRINTFLEQYI